MAIILTRKITSWKISIETHKSCAYRKQRIKTSRKHDNFYDISVLATAGFNNLPAGGGLGVLKLLLHARHLGLTVETLEGAGYELRVNRVGPHHLYRYWIIYI